MTFAADNTADAGELGGKELIIVDEGIVAIKEIPFLAFLGRKFLQESADFGDDSDKIIKLGGGNFVIFEAGGPLGSDEETVGPAERLPNSFGDERSKGVKHFEDHLESDFEKREIFVNLLALNEPVGVFIPDSGIESFDGFGEAIVLKIVFDGFFAGGELAANPVFTKVIGRIRRLLAGLDLALVDDGGGELLV